MESPVELLALNCIRCGFPIPAELHEVAWICTNCSQGQCLSDNGLVPLTIHTSRAIQPNQVGRPFWVAEGQVRMDRAAYGTFGKKTKAAQNFWGQPRKFIIPAFEFKLQNFIQAGVDWLKNPPALDEGPSAPFESVTVMPEDVTPWCEFLVLALEASRKDKLKTINFKLELGDPVLWVLPAK